ncbi:MAG: hypothetical protein DLM55_12255 [Acidimicrobiales bacterium]|nr:MAG: hypothetical protein DLM55_12255 [Acidimicrobiales bacterium]
MSRTGSALRGFVAFWWDFIVGDDWRIAGGVIVALTATTALARTSVPAWWLLPVAVAALLAISLWRAVRASLT